jgi:2,3-dihydroxyphenylpropionate 1,2-dioxygenase
MTGNPDAPVNADGNRWFLGQLRTLALDPGVAFGHEKLEHEAGSGGHEVRTWLVGHSAAGLPLVWTATARSQWITGRGLGTTPQ